MEEKEKENKLLFLKAAGEEPERACLVDISAGISANLGSHLPAC